MEIIKENESAYIKYNVSNSTKLTSYFDRSGEVGIVEIQLDKNMDLIGEFKIVIGEKTLTEKDFINDVYFVAHKLKFPKTVVKDCSILFEKDEKIEFECSESNNFKIKEISIWFKSLQLI